MAEPANDPVLRAAILAELKEALRDKSREEPEPADETPWARILRLKAAAMRRTKI